MIACSTWIWGSPSVMCRRTTQKSTASLYASHTRAIDELGTCASAIGIGLSDDTWMRSSQSL